MLSVAIKLIMLNIIMLSVIMISVIMLNVVALFVFDRLEKALNFIVSCKHIFLLFVRWAGSDQQINKFSVIKGSSLD